MLVFGIGGLALRPILLALAFGISGFVLVSLALNALALAQITRPKLWKTVPDI